jgi:hypothetical protein
MPGLLSESDFGAPPTVELSDEAKQAIERNVLQIMDQVAVSIGLLLATATGNAVKQFNTMTARVVNDVLFDRTDGEQ